MRLETLPLILGVLIGLIGIGLILDAWAPDNMIVPTERRRRPRRERDRWGEALVGLGVVAMAAAFIGRDTWRYSIVTVIAGAVLLLWGTKRNGGYLRDVFAKSDVPKVAVPKVAVPKVAEGSRRIR
jgi:hypothetical protein